MGAVVRRAVAGVALLGSVSACASYSPSEVANPTDLTIDQAMADVGTGFVRLRQELDKAPRELRLGLYPCRVEVALNVTANAARGGRLVLDASLKPPVKVVEAGVAVQAAQENTSAASRGNTVTIVMENPTCPLLAGLAGKAAPAAAPAAGKDGAAPAPKAAPATGGMPFKSPEEMARYIDVITRGVRSGAPYRLELEGGNRIYSPLDANVPRE